MKRSKLIYLLFFLIIMSCSGKTKFDVDLPKDTVDLTISRFDQELFQSDIYKLRENNSKWIKEYGLLYESFIYEMINSGLPQDPMVVLRLEKFRNDSSIQQTNEELSKTFKNFDPFEQKLENAFTYYTNYFPNKTIPKIITFYSNFNAKTFPYSDTLGIGLDMFIGRDNKITQLLPSSYSSYMKQDMDSEYLVTEAMKSWIYFNFSWPGEYHNSANYGTRDNFLSTLIYHGKMMVALESMFPETPIETLFEYTKSELKWCERNETALYQNLVEFNLIYSKNRKEMVAYVYPGNFTPGIPNSPGGVGKWIGYRMVRQYYLESEISLQNLVLTEKDERKILSFYRP